MPRRDIQLNYALYLYMVEVLGVDAIIRPRKKVVNADLGGSCSWNPTRENESPKFAEPSKLATPETFSMNESMPPVENLDIRGGGLRHRDSDPAAASDTTPGRDRKPNQDLGQDRNQDPNQYRNQSKNVHEYQNSYAAYDKAKEKIKVEESRRPQERNRKSHPNLEPNENPRVLREDLGLLSDLLVVAWKTSENLFSLKQGPRGDLLLKMLLATQIPLEKISFVEVEASQIEYDEKLWVELGALIKQCETSSVFFFHPDEKADECYLWLKKHLGAPISLEANSQTVFGTAFETDGVRWWLSYDPQTLLDTSLKKKESWEHLKSLMNYLRSQRR